MSKTIKVIDLLNMIAKGEQPKRFKYKGREYLYSVDDKEFRSLKQEYRSGDLPEYVYLSEETNLSNLNDEVEIEEQPEIDIQSIENVAKVTFNFHKDSYTPKQISDNFETIVELLNMQSDKQNELVRAVKQLEKRKEK